MELNLKTLILSIKLVLDKEIKADMDHKLVVKLAILISPIECKKLKMHQLFKKNKKFLIKLRLVLMATASISYLLLVKDQMHLLILISLIKMFPMKDMKKKRLTQV
jgi:hypothetical protein